MLDRVVEGVGWVEDVGHQGDASNVWCIGAGDGVGGVGGVDGMDGCVL